MRSEPRGEGRSVVGPIFHGTNLHRSKNKSRVYEDVRKSHENNTPTPRSEGITWTNRIGSACNLLRVVSQELTRQQRFLTRFL